MNIAPFAAVLSSLVIFVEVFPRLGFLGLKGLKLIPFGWANNYNWSFCFPIESSPSYEAILHSALVIAAKSVQQQQNPYKFIDMHILTCIRTMDIRLLRAVHKNPSGNSIWGISHSNRHATCNVNSKVSWEGFAYGEYYVYLWG
jgi:hypothetical protein